MFVIKSVYVGYFRVYRASYALFLLLTTHLHDHCRINKADGIQKNTVKLLE